MSARGRIGAITLAGVLSGLWLGGAQASQDGSGGVYSQDQLKAIYAAAVQEFDLHAERCVAPVGAVGGDPAAEAAFVRSALMLRLVADKFSFPAGREAERSKMIYRAMVGYERAFDCAPVWTHRHHLIDAFEVADAHIQYVRTVERRALDEPSIDAVIKERQRVWARLEGLREPMCPRKEDLCPVDEVRTEEGPVVDPMSGYQGWAGRLSLRLEIGGGAVRTRESGDTSAVREGAVGMMLSAGSRFVLGEQRRHRFVLGGVYGLARYEHLAENPRAAHWLLTRGEYALAAHPRWLSLQLAVEVGMGLIRKPLDDLVVAHGVSGLSGGVCIVDEIVCARVRWLTTPKRQDHLTGLFGLLGVDIFRLVDLHTDVNRPRKPK